MIGSSDNRIFVTEKVNNLYDKLHKGSHGWDENFLTAGLVHLLKFLQVNEPENFIIVTRWVTRGIITPRIDQTRLVDIQTEIHTTFGRPDISIQFDKSLIFVEVKVDSFLGTEQIEKYQVALNQSGYKKNRTGLVCLTRYSNLQTVGDGFLAISWHQLSANLETLLIEHPVARYLRDQYIQFLKIRGVAMTHVDVELIQGIESLGNLMGMIELALTNAKLSVKSSKTADWHGYRHWVNSDRAIWAGVYFKAPNELLIMTEACSFSTTDPVDFGDIVDRNWRNILDLSAGFFDLSEHDQLKCVEEYVKKSTDYAIFLIKSEEEAEK